MPSILYLALNKIYADRGWDAANGTNPRGYSPEVQPTLTDLYQTIEQVTQERGYDQQVTANIRSGLQTRLALMGSSLSPAQEGLIRKHTDSNSHVIVMLDEDEAGQAAREEIAGRLAKFCYVKVHLFNEAGTQPEHLSFEEVQDLMGGAS
jgi:hypothetical protein